MYLHQCEGRHFIPIWLIVFGAFSLLQIAINIIKRFSRRCITPYIECGTRSCCCLEFLIIIFLFVWTIVGSYWVFGFYWQYASCSSSHGVPCCHPVPYIFSFVTLILIYFLVFMTVSCCCCCFFYLAFICASLAVSDD